MSHTEIDLYDAKAIVEWVLGVDLEPSDRSSGLAPDFDLFEGGGRTGAMVVARSARPPHPQSWKSVRHLTWDARGLHRSWVVRLETSTRSGPDERMILGLLAELELSGGSGFQRSDQVRVASLRAAGVRLSPAERLLEDLAVFGVIGAESGDTVPRTVVVKVGEVAFASVEVVNEAVEDEAWRAENRIRLGATDAADRHLFVWLDGANFVAHAAMDPDRLPVSPLLAPDTTTFWVARRPALHDDLLADRVWQTNGGGEWESLGPVMRRRLVGPGIRG